MSTTTTETFACDCCGAETPREQEAYLTDGKKPVCLGCESRQLASDSWAARAAYDMLHTAARSALAGYLSPADASAAVAEAIAEMNTVPQITFAAMLDAERQNVERRARLEQGEAS